MIAEDVATRGTIVVIIAAGARAIMIDSQEASEALADIDDIVQRVRQSQHL